MVLQPGDVVLTRGKSWVSAAIRFFTRGWGESPTRVNHAGIIVESGDITQAVIVEALRVVSKHKLWEQYANRDEIAIYRRKTLPLGARQKLVQKTLSYVGKPYGYLKIVAHNLDYFFFGLNIFRRLCRLENYPMCSWLVARAYREVNVQFGVPYVECTPDHIWDYVNGHPEEWECIWPLARLDELTIPRDVILAGNHNLKENLDA